LTHEAAMSIYEFNVRTIEGAEMSLGAFRDRVLLIVNVASQCRFTPQYAGLEQLHRKLGPRGFAVLGFPCNQFGHQEPDSEAHIRQFCSTSYEVSFPLFAKIEVNGSGAHPLYQHLKKARPGVLGTQTIKWNFTKFLVDRQGNAVKRYAPSDTPEKIEGEIAALLPAFPA
jgi:glutathione peroxidase